MIIRNANIIDIEKIANLYVTNWKNTYSELLPQDFLDSLTVNSAIYKWSNYLNSENNKLFVAYEKDEFLGFVSSKVDDEDAHWWYLDSLHVSPEFQSKGIGKSLILKTAEFALENSYDTMTISILRGNDKAEKIYQYLGAVYLNDFINYFDNTSAMSTVFIWKDLPKLISKHSK